MLWRVLAETVMVLHLLIIAFLAVATILLALGIFRRHRNWRYFFYGVVVMALGFGIASSTKILRTCPITDLEYMLRRLYRPQRKLDANAVAPAAPWYII